MKLPPIFDAPAQALVRERWGWPGALSLLALAAAALLALGLAPRWSAQAQALVATFEQTASRADRQHATAAAPPASGQAWPSAEQTPERVAGLLRLAAPAGLRVVRSSEQAAAAGHLQLSLGAVGSYGALRSYLSRALAADPALVLQQLRLQRDDDDAAPLRADMRRVLLQDGGAPAQPGAAP